MNDLAVPAELETKAPAFLSWARGLTTAPIASPAGYEFVASHLKAIKAAMKQCAEFFRPAKQRTYEAHRAVLEMEKRLAGPLAEAETLTKAALQAYDDEQDRLRLEEQRLLQAAADERARREREALEKRAAAARKPETRERLQEQAAAVLAPVVYVPSAAPKVDGLSRRRTWKARIVDRPKFMQRVFDDRRAEAVEPNLDFLDALAKALREQASWPGVEFYEETSLAVGSR